MQTTLSPVIGQNISLQKLLVGADLCLQQVRHIQDGLTFAEILADALFFRERITHVHLPPVRWCLTKYMQKQAGDTCPQPISIQPR